MSKKYCNVQMSFGGFCKNEPIKDQKCFWHSDIEKTNENIKKYFPKYNSLNELLQNENPDLEKVQFTKLELKYSDFSGLNLKGSYFAESNLQYSNFEKANLESAFLANADFSYANMKSCNFQKASLARTNFQHAILDNVSFNHTKLKESDLSFASLKNVKFSNTKLIFVNLYKAILDNVKFSNKETQLKFVNTSNKDNLVYFKNKSIEWVKSGDYNSCTKVLEFYFKQIPKDDFEYWMRSVFRISSKRMKQIQKESDIEKMASILEFVSRLIKITGIIPYQLSLPSPPESEINSYSENKLRLKFILEKSSISLYEYNRLIHFLKCFVDAILKAFDLESDKLNIPNINYISLQSPLEILLVFSILSPIVPFIIKTISWFQDLVLKHYSIKEKKLAIIKSENEINLLNLQQKKLIFELSNKIQNESPDIKKEDAINISLHLNNYISNIIDSKHIFEHKIFSESAEISLKGIEQLKSKKDKELK